MSSQSINFGIIGLGYIGKRHANVIKSNPNCNLVAACDIKNLKDLDYDVSSFYQSPIDMLDNHPEIDVVCVCTPNGLHAQHSLVALNRSKHVIIEKPMALNKKDAEEILHTSIKKNRSVFCVMQNRYSPPSQLLKRIVDEGILGKIFIVQLNCYWNRDERYYKTGGWKGTRSLDGGTLYTQFSHWIDIMYWLFGDIENPIGRFESFNHSHLTEFEDTGLISFNFKNGGFGCINYSTAVWGSNLESSITIVGEKGSIKIGGQYLDKIEYCNIDNFELPDLKPTNAANAYSGYVGSANNHPEVFENVVECLTGDSEITTNVLDGLKVVEIIEKIYGLKK